MYGTVILIIDDEQDGLDLISTILEGAGLDHIQCTSGKEGLSLLESDSGAVDLILLDIMMPGMDGFEVLRRMSASQEFKEIPVIVVTASDDPQSIEESFDLGAFDHLTKPYEPISLIARTKAAIRFSEARKELKDNNAVMSELISESEAQRKKLEDNLSYMNDLVDILDHKIKNKLVPIIAYSETFKDIPGSSEANSAFRNIHISSIQLTETIEDILSDMKARTRSGGTYLNDMDIRSLLKGIHQKNLLLLRESGLLMEISVHENVPETILTDITMFYDIVDNLVSNSIKYSREGGRIQVHASLDSKDGSGILAIAVKDDGIGIEEENQSRIFDRNFIVPLEGFDRNLNRTGMGLFLVSKFVASLNGNIEVKSEPGKGTEFLVSFPIILVDQSSVV